MDWPDSWSGYLPPTSNTTYTPNQFFDVVLPYSSRGVVRLVAYMIRKTLGWSDAQGRPQEPQIKVSYRELERKAGIAQSKLRAALNEAIEARFIQCIHDGHPDTHGVQGISALYELVWDESEDYSIDPQQFQGFFAGNGNLTYIPNQFFDTTIPQEPLAVIRVVGTIIRHTIGWQTKFGFRRQEVEMSFSELERRANLSRQSINLALQTALQHQHLVRVEAGIFDADTKLQKVATYGIKWADAEASGASEGDRLQKLTREPPPKVDQNRLQKLTRTASKSLPGNRLQKLTSIEITPIEITPEKQKQQPQQSVSPASLSEATAAAAFLNTSKETYELLRSRGLGYKAANEFASHPEEYLNATWDLVKKKQKPGSSLTGLYCTALRENWLEEQDAIARAKKQASQKTDSPENVVRVAPQALKEKHLPKLQEVFRKVQRDMPDVFARFEAFRTKEREKLSKIFSLATAREPALRGFDSEENTLRVFVLFLKENGCPLSEYQSWMDKHPPSELIKMFA